MELQVSRTTIIAEENIASQYDEKWNFNMDLPCLPVEALCITRFNYSVPFKKYLLIDACDLLCPKYIPVCSHDLDVSLLLAALPT